jgi:hypothetical protein
MDISILGFNLLPGCDEIALDDVLAEIAANPLRTDDNRIVAVIRDGPNWKGVVLSIRNVKHFTKIQQQENGRFRISAEEMQDGSQPVDFNFFVINTRTNRGLFQHYFQSSSLNHFCWLVKTKYDELRKSRREEALQGLGEDASAREKTRVRRRFDGTLLYQLLARPESFTQCVESLARLKVFEFQYAEFRPVERSFRALEGVTKRVTHRVVFERYATPNDQRRSVVEFVRNANLAKAKVIGMDPHGLQEIFHLNNDLATFGSYDYDHMVNGMLIDSENLPETINNCAITGHLVALMDTRKVRAMFAAAVEGEAEEPDGDEA